MEETVRALPKVELHVHLEGTLSPEAMLALARRNRIPPPFASVREARRAYRFRNLQSFLDLYYRGTSVLRTVRDFADLAAAYAASARSQGIRRAEVFLDPQSHTERGVPFETVIRGVLGGLEAEERRGGFSFGLIICFLRDRPVDHALETLDLALPFRDRIQAVGLDSAELDHPPSAFARVFDRARDHGFRVVAHAGEEGPPRYIWEALDVLGACRIDHGVRCLEDPALVRRLARDRVPLTVCPVSNVRLGVVPSLDRHPLGEMLDRGLAVSVHSDDPAYFGADLVGNLLAVQRALGLGPSRLRELARNAVEASFLEPGAKAALAAEVDRVAGEAG